MKMFILSIFITFIISSATKGSPICYRCSDISYPHVCDTITQCGPHEECYVEKFTSEDGITYYESGCKSIRECTQTLRTGGGLPECTECCNSDFCNKYLCNTRTDFNISRCLSCNAVSSPTDCRKVTSCTEDQRCFTQETISFGMKLFVLGCREKSACHESPIFGKRSSRKRTSKCSMCCDGENCNRNICTDEPNSQHSVSVSKPTTKSQDPGSSPSTLMLRPSTTTISMSRRRDCKAILSEGYTQNGVYNLSISGVMFPAYCDMADGGWTVFQRRVNGRVDFNRTWTDYENGFGDLNADHWLGLKYIHLLTKPKVKIMFELLIDSSKQNATAVYYDFYVDDKLTNYTMHVLPNATYSNEMAKFIDSENGLFYHNGMQFSTIDIDNDEYGLNCAVYVKDLRGGAYWNKSCYQFGAFNNVFNELYISYRGEKRLAYVQIKVLDY